VPHLRDGFIVAKVGLQDFDGAIEAFDLWNRIAHTRDYPP
jgi:hypothetical protein